MRALGTLVALYATSSVGAESEAYRVALARTYSRYSVFSAGAFTQVGGHVEKFGACSFEYTSNKATFRCLANQDYPFAGAVFQTVQSQPFPTVSVLSCVAGCVKGVPQFIHEISQDIPSNGKTFEAEQKKRISGFRRVWQKMRLRPLHSDQGRYGLRPPLDATKTGSTLPITSGSNAYLVSSSGTDCLAGARLA